MRRPNREGAPSDEMADAAEAAPCEGCKAPHRSQFGFSSFEQRILDFVRLILDMHRNDSANAWTTAIDLAERAEGPSEGPYVIARVTALTRALLAERQRPYAYMTAGCMHVSSDEADLMRVIRLARTGPFGEFKAAAQTLAGRDDVSRIIASATALAQPEELRRAAARRALDDDAPREAPATLH